MPIADAADLAARVRAASRVTVMTGAGISAASEVQTFRGPGRLWRTHRPEQLATPEPLAADPPLVWEWYDWRRRTVATCRPNRDHEVLAAWRARVPTFTLITQNADGLHERAGTHEVVFFHGSTWQIRCAAGCAESRGDCRSDTLPLPLLPVRCPHCDGLARPGVVWFGEGIDRSLAATACDLFVTVGTSAVVYPAASLLHEAKRRGAVTVKINLDVTPASPLVDLVLHDPAERILDQVEALLR